ncbi:MAG: ATP-grasp domain-containing protein [Bacteroidales bacterium]|nr:ATP-grasp domain-containing protein [Bacteroidales bacterium]MBR1783159.1 ATP-grasp domain-containing protein [Bacteroidales bacterium]MBR1783739.1 ATP-grasp domain-containing protein [Bacteroidales bacterium]
MAKYQSIAVIYGSDSSEWEVSCRSGEFTASRIDEFQYDVYEVFARFGQWHLVAMRKANSMRQAFPEGARPVVDKSDFSVIVLGEKIKFDFAYIMQHGAPGETGLLQGYFEMLGIPHSTCSAFVTTVAFDKYACKSYLRGQNLVKMAPDAVIHIGDDIDAFSSATIEKLGLPLFVKPTRGGSSFGITKVEKAEDLPAAIRFAFTEGELVIVEKAVKSQHELTCGVYRDGKEIKALPIIEIVSQTGWFDYDAKYNGLSQEICPAPVSGELTSLVQETSKRIYRYLGCKGLVRMDYLSAEDGLYFLEANIIPGMTNASLVPKMIRTSGQSITDFLTTIIENS